MIKIVNSSFQRLGVIRTVISSERREELNGENTLDFEAHLTDQNKQWITPDSIFEVDGQYFDVGYLENGINDDDQLICRVECDHISYRLNRQEYDMEPYDETDFPEGFQPMDDQPPSVVFNTILAGTGFTGIVDSTITETAMDYWIESGSTRRQMVIDFADRLAADIIYDNFAIQITKHRGDTNYKTAILGKNVTNLTKQIDKRERQTDPAKPYSLTYECEIIDNDVTELYNLGDDVRIIDHDLGIDVIQRVITVINDPNNLNEPKQLILGDVSRRAFEQTLEDVIGNTQNPIDYYPAGPEGPEGIAGPQGPQGEQGEPGEPGPAGANAPIPLAYRNNIRNEITFEQSTNGILVDDEIHIKNNGVEYILDIDADPENGSMLVSDNSTDPPTLKFSNYREIVSSYNISVVATLPAIADAQTDVLYLVLK